MTAQDEIPDRATLRRFLLGELSVEELESVEEHLRLCPETQAILHDLEVNDTLLTALRTAKPEVEHLPSDMHRFMLRMENVGSATHQSSADQTSLLQPVSGNSMQADPRIPTERSYPYLAPPQAADEIGRLGSYRILKEIGSGGMATVFLADDTELKRQVALKVIRPEWAAHPEIRQRFQREAQTAASLSHEHIVSIHHVGKEGTTPFIVMQYLEGESLDDRMKRVGKLPVSEVLRIGRETAEGLEAANQRGLIHRDIKPANIFLEKHGDSFRVKVLDFGLARPQGRDIALTQTGAIVGTPEFMCPEQAAGEEVDARGDLFSLGIVLYKALTDVSPFSDKNHTAVLMAVTSRTPIAPNAIDPAIPDSVSDFVLRLLEKDPNKRPASATEVVATLRQLESGAIPPAPARRVEQPAPRTRRSVFPRWAIAASALLLLGGAVALYQFELKTKDGTFTVEVSGDADVRFKNGELHIYGDDGKLKYTLKPSERNAKIAPGNYKLKVIGADGVVLDTNEFTMTKNGNVVIRVTAKPQTPPFAITNPKDPAPSNSDRRAAEHVITNGGVVRLNDDGHLVPPPVLLTDLPQGPFRLTTVIFNWKPHFGDANMPNFKDCVNLTQLVLSGTKVTDDGVVYIKDCKALAYLDLAETSVGDAGLTTLQNLKSLRHLNVRKTKVTTAGIEKLQNALPQCKIAWDGDDLGPPPSSDPDRKGAEWVLSVGGFVRVNGEYRYRRHGELPKEPFRLTYVLLHDNNRVTDTGLVVFQNCKDIEGLSIARCPQVTDAGLAHFRQCTKLESLFLERINFTDAGLVHFKNCISLKRLDLHITLNQIQIGDEGVRHFKDCTELVQIGVTWTSRITDDTMRIILNWKKVESLNLTHTGVTNDGLAFLKDHTSLRMLALGGTQITNKGLMQLEGYAQLRELHLEDTTIKLEDVSAFAEKRPYCRIKYSGGEHVPEKWSDRWFAEYALSVGGSVRVNDEQREHRTIADLPKEPFRLTWVKIGLSLRATNEHLYYVGCENLKHLDLSGSLFSGVSWITLCKNLVYLDLSKTNFTEAQVEEINKALPKCKIVWEPKK